jgi:hypothetical protein
VSEVALGADFRIRGMDALGRATAVGGDLKMSSGLVWRALLFFGLTASYVILAALPYLA